VLRAVRLAIWRPSPVGRRRRQVALAVAVLSDVIQWVFFPVMAEGAASPFDVALDALTAAIILLAVGFQWRLAIALAVEVVPGLDMFPTWTAVVLTIPTAPKELPPPE
jgi:hypothetical protein